MEPTKERSSEEPEWKNITNASTVEQLGFKVTFIVYKKVVQQCVVIYLKISTEKTSE